MRMKKLTAILSALIMVLALFAGCSGGGKVDDGNNTDSPDQSPAAESSEPTNEYTLGNRTETEWQSDWIGLKYTLTDDMVMATDEEINQLMLSGTEMVYENPEDAQPIIDYAGLTVVYEMMATSVMDGSNLIVMVEKLPLSNMSESQYMNILKQQINGMDVEVSYNDDSARMVSGIEFTEFSYEMTTSGMTISQNYLLHKIDDRMVVLTLSYSTPEQMDAILSGLSAI